MSYPEKNDDHTITFSTHQGDESRVVLTITAEGRFVLGPGATHDEAAQAIVDIATKLFREQGGSEPKEPWQQ